MSETITRQQIIQLIDTLPRETLPELTQFVEFLRYKTRAAEASRPSAEDQKLVAVVQRRLSSSDQQRLDLLRQKNQDGSLTEAEHAELLQWVTQIEEQDAARAQAIVELARLRNAPVVSILREYSPEYVTHAD